MAGEVKNWEIYLDVDGVCADFITPGLRAIGQNPELILEQWQDKYAGEFYPEALIGMPPKQLFYELDKLGAAFWAELSPFPWFPDLYYELSSYGHVVFLTAPTGFPDCLAGKYQWLCNFFGEGFTDCVFTEHKERLAHPNAILIDDSDRNIERFGERGGNGIIFPCFWNKGGETDNPMAAILDRISEVVA